MVYWLRYLTRDVRTENFLECPGSRQLPITVLDKKELVKHICERVLRLPVYLVLDFIPAN
jgi:hypothetical protein